MAIIELIGPTAVGKSTLARAFMLSNPEDRPCTPGELAKGPARAPSLGPVDAFLLSRLLPRLVDQHKGNGSIFDFYHRLDYFYRKLIQDARAREHYATRAVLDDDPVSHLFLAELVALTRDESRFEEFTRHRRYVFIRNSIGKVLENHRARASTTYRALNGFSMTMLESKIVAPYLEQMDLLKNHLDRNAVKFFEIDLARGVSQGVEELKRVLKEFAPPPPEGPP